jgi:Domain of unknown function (DU1801)
MALSTSKEVMTPEEYIAGLEEPRRKQVRGLHDLIRKTLPHLEPRVRSGMIGYGTYHYRYASGREGDSFVIGLASNKRYISLYVCGADPEGYVAERYRSKLPNADIGKSCVRLKRLDDVDSTVLAELIAQGARACETLGDSNSR